MSAALPSFAVLIPFRDLDPRQERGVQLAEWVAKAPPVLDAAWGPGSWVVLVVKQSSSDGHKFARGRLLNAGARFVGAMWPSVHTLVLHDVDLLMDEARAAAATTPPPAPGEIRALNTDSPLYRECALYVGGVCAVAAESFVDANGFWNGFEGWGGEDDCLRDAFRATFARFALTAPVQGTVTDVHPVPYRCARDPEAKMPAEVRRRHKAAAAAAAYLGNGLRELVFRVVSPGGAVSDLGPCVFAVEVDVFPPPLDPHWVMAMSSSRKLPYYFHTRTRASTFDWPSQ